jgi:hypothetical protein
MGSEDGEVKGGPARMQLDALFAEEVASGHRARWIAVQQGFVDDPRGAVEEGYQLVQQVMGSLAEGFSKDRAALEAELRDSHRASTEMLRIALRRYRSFFERLLAL